MRLLYDAQIFNMQRFGGISRLYSELFTNFDQETLIEWRLELDFPHNAYIEMLEHHGRRLTAYKKLFWGLHFKGKGRIYNTIRGMGIYNDERRRTLQLLEKKQLNLFHPTYYDDYFLESLKGTPFVITVYDMIHELFFKDLKDTETIRRKKSLVETAQRVIAISEATKKDLVRLTGINQSKVDVVPLSSSIALPHTTNNVASKPQRYVLYVGQREGYKNFCRFFRAITPLMQADQTIYLICIGGKVIDASFTETEKKLISESKLTNRVLLKSATDTELAEWYAGALCFVFPSLYEGFGIPVLEAFACGCPVAASNTSSLPEVGGDGAVYFEPQSEEGIRDVVISLIEDSEYRQHLTELGRKRATYFSWQDTARKTVEVYKKALSR